jgi:hypothetical protein
MTVSRSNLVHSGRSTLRVHTRSQRLAPLTLVAGGIAASLFALATAHGAVVDQPLFTWSGRVDREVYITMRGRDVRVTGDDGSQLGRPRVSGNLPRNVGAVYVTVNDGRGQVEVVEQPTVRNGYQTVVRIRDPRSGADTYRITARYQGDSRYDDRADNRRDDDRYDDRNGDKPGRGGGWGAGGRRDGEAFPGRGNGKGRDNNTRADDRNNGNGDYDRDRGGATRGESGVLHWSGRVDDVVEVRLTGRRVETVTRSGVRVQEVASDVRGAGLPQRAVSLNIDQQSGRGSVVVAQQPAAWNNYTAIIRINDSRSGAAYYDFTVNW